MIIDILNNPSIGTPVMFVVIVWMNYYIKKHQLVKIQEAYDKLVEEQNNKTQKLTRELLSDICFLDTCR